MRVRARRKFFCSSLRRLSPVLLQTDLNGIVTKTFENLKIPENIELTTKLCKIPQILLDPEQIKRVCQNLVQNAIKPCLRAEN
jgi:signal transduction histidine kinase